jgi:Protein of unknown function (DUF3352)
MTLHRKPCGLAALALAAGALCASGCGSSGSSGSSIDPAKAVPASAALYAGAVVRPQGSLQAAAREAGRTLTHQADPYLHLLAALQTPGSPTPDFKRDVGPWLGPQAGVFVSAVPARQSGAALEKLFALVEQGLLGRSTGGAFPFAAGGLEGAIVLDTRDTAKARSFLRSLAQRAGAHAASFRGTSYQVSAGGIAFGIVSRLAVIGTEQALHAVIETTSGGPALASEPEYAKLLAVAPPGSLAHLYANPEAKRGALPHGASSALSLLAGGHALDVSLVPSRNSITMDADTLRSGAAAGLLASSSGAARALGELPGESWLAVGLGNLGGALGSSASGLQGIASLGGLITGTGSEAQSAGINVKSLLAGLLAPVRALAGGSAQTQRELTGWMGSAALFASGTGLLELRGAIVIESKDPSLSRAAVAKLATILRSGGGSVQSTTIAGTDAAVEARLSGLPVALDIANGTAANGRSKLVIGIGQASVETALKPSSTLSAAAPYGAAAAAIGGGRPSVIVDFPTLLQLLEGVGLSEDPTIAPFVPYLRSLTTLSGGGSDLGDGIERFRLVLGLQQAE